MSAISFTAMVGAGVATASGAVAGVWQAASSSAVASRHNWGNEQALAYRFGIASALQAMDQSMAGADEICLKESRERPAVTKSS
ncbi:hypothetical protein [Nevskia ramosa]|uniref:hypothetical protein n=1 Tax=Nevskia ramosa TaxID=64002 RepID=UPI00146CAC56|nr:hypothetical protein [Nevskia ramosa]